MRIGTYELTIGTGLTGHSHQRYQTVAGLDLDLDKMVTITLRLVHAEADEPRPLQPVGWGNAVPPPVG